MNEQQTAPTLRDEAREIIARYWSLDDGYSRDDLADDLAEWGESKIAASAEELEALREILKMTEERLGEYLRGETLSKGKLRSMALIIGRALE